MADIRIQRDDFVPGAEIAALSDGRTDVGAVASFVGLVRADEKLTAMTLEHYEEFARREILAHVAEAEARWPLLAVCGPPSRATGTWRADCLCRGRVGSPTGRVRSGRVPDGLP